MLEDEEFNSSQVPDTVSKQEIRDLIDSIPKPACQKPFQPGSSPSDEADRFLCWNSTGIIRTISHGIDVMFHDAEKHLSINFQNDFNYSLGSMSDDAIIVASNGKYNTGPSMLHGVNLLEDNRDKQEWELELPNIELTECVAAGSGFVAVATDHRNLRLFSNGGRQSYILSLPGQVLCMNAQENQLMIIYHNGSGHTDDQNLSMFLYYIDLAANIIRLLHGAVPVAVSKRSPLSWAGFSDEGTPCCYDYNGMLRMYRQDLAQSWVPLLDLRALTSSALDHYFVVGVNETGKSVRAVKCKRSRFPAIGSETTEVLPFCLPFCATDTDVGKLEEEFIKLKLSELTQNRLGMPQDSHTEKLLVNTVLRLFATYLKEDKEELARELVFLVPKAHASKLPEFAWKTKRRQYFIDSLNKAIEERESIESQYSDKDF